MDGWMDVKGMDERMDAARLMGEAQGREKSGSTQKEQTLHHNVFFF